MSEGFVAGIVNAVGLRLSSDASWLLPTALTMCVVAIASWYFVPAQDAREVKRRQFAERRATLETYEKASTTAQELAALQATPEFQQWFSQNRSAVQARQDNLERGTQLTLLTCMFVAICISLMVPFEFSNNDSLFKIISQQVRKNSSAPDATATGSLAVLVATASSLSIHALLILVSTWTYFLTFAVQGDIADALNVVTLISTLALLNAVRLGYGFFGVFLCTAFKVFGPTLYLY